MPRGAYSSLGDRQENLLASRQEVEAQVTRLKREEEYLLLQVRQAREQVRYYEELLSLLRRDWGKTAPLQELVRKLG